MTNEIKQDTEYNKTHDGTEYIAVTATGGSCVGCHALDNPELCALLCNGVDEDGEPYKTEDTIWRKSTFAKTKKGTDSKEVTVYG